MTTHEALGDMISVAWLMTGAVDADPNLTDEQRVHVRDMIKRIQAAREVWRSNIGKGSE